MIILYYRLKDQKSVKVRYGKEKLLGYIYQNHLSLSNIALLELGITPIGSFDISCVV